MVSYICGLRTLGQPCEVSSRKSQDGAHHVAVPICDVKETEGRPLAGPTIRYNGKQPTLAVSRSTLCNGAFRGAEFGGRCCRDGAQGAGRAWTSCGMEHGWSMQALERGKFLFEARHRSQLQ